VEQKGRLGDDAHVPTLRGRAELGLIHVNAACAAASNVIASTAEERAWKREVIMVQPEARND
jgi:hypothetical protein